MKKQKYDDIIIDKLNELYKTYENYIWQDKKNRKLIVVFQKDMMLSFYLYEDNEIVDELTLKFDNKEEKLYQSLCLKLFIILLGNVYIYKEDNVYFNIKHKNYLGVVVGNDKLNNIINELVLNQNEKVINKDNDIIKNKLLIKNKKYSKSFLDELDKRIDLSKKMLRGW